MFHWEKEYCGDEIWFVNCVIAIEIFSARVTWAEKIAHRFGNLSEIINLGCFNFLHLVGFFLNHIVKNMYALVIAVLADPPVYFSPLSLSIFAPGHGEHRRYFSLF